MQRADCLAVGFQNPNAENQELGLGFSGFSVWGLGLRGLGFRSAHRVALFYIWAAGFVWSLLEGILYALIIWSCIVWRGY